MINNKHDTWARAVLMNKKEASIFINLALELKEEYKIEENKLILQDNRFVTKSFYNKETDILYKIENKNVYVLIEHQSTVDKHMAKRIIEYIVEIIRKDEKNRKIEDSKYKLPLVIPIVLYTGKRKWKAEKSIIQIQERLPGYKNENFGEYVLIDTNEYNEEKLLNTKGILSKIILLDKTKCSKEIEEMYDKIEANKLSKEEKVMLNEYMCNISVDLISEDKFKELREKYKIEEGGKQMLVETLRKEIKREGKKLGEKLAKDLAKELVEKETKEIRKEAKKEGMKQGQIIGLEKVAKVMLKENIDIETIKRCTLLSDEKLKKLKVKNHNI